MFNDPITAAPQALLSMRFSRQGPWNGLPFPSPGDLPDPRINPWFPALHFSTTRALSARPSASRVPHQQGLPGAVGAGGTRHPPQRGAAPSQGRRGGPRDPEKRGRRGPAGTRLVCSSCPPRSHGAGAVLGLLASCPPPCGHSEPLLPSLPGRPGSLEILRRDLARGQGSEAGAL